MNTTSLRAAAVIFDIGLLFLTFLAIREAILALAFAGQGGMAGAGGGGNGVFIYACIGGALTLYGLCCGVLRSSPGKWAVGFDLVSINGRTPGFFRVVLREQVRLAEIVFFVSAFFSFLNLMEDRPSRTDAVCQTFVRNRRRNGLRVGLDYLKTAMLARPSRE